MKFKKIFLLVAITVAILLIGKSANSQVILNQDWDTATVFTSKGFYPYAVCQPYGATIVNDASIRCSKCIRFEIHAEDPLCAQGKRASIYWPYDAVKAAENYQWDEYIPTDYTTYDYRAEGHFALSKYSGNGPGSGILHLWVEKGRWVFVQEFDSVNALTNARLKIVKKDLGAVVGGKWIHWEYRVHFAKGNAGKVEVYKDGVRVVNLTGTNCNVVNGEVIKHFPRWGIYKWPWNTGGPYSPNKRVVYMDNIRISAAYDGDDPL